MAPVAGYRATGAARYPAITTRGTFYFRGQGGSDWPLMSSFDRWFKSSNTTGLNKKQASERLLLLFKEELGRLTPDPGVSHNSEELLAIAQHYGVPTRLLDWTESPYVAAFFAFSGIASSSTSDALVAIWCLDTTSSLWQKDTGIRRLTIPSLYNARLKNQLGKFTLLQSPFDGVEEHIAHCDSDRGTLKRICLPATEARAAFADLDFMGINYSTIYPGLEGCARVAKLRMLLEQYAATELNVRGVRSAN